MALFENNPATGAGILSAGSSLLSGAGNVVSTLLANRANRKLAEYSFEQQKQMIAEQNRYNSPAEQIKRYEEAGLNPALIYGNGTSSAGNQSSLAKYEAPTIQAPNVNVDLAQALAMALQYQETKAKVRLIDEQAYAQKQIGLGYQLDNYQKQIDTAIKGINAGLSNPPGVLTPTELDELRKGNIVRRYDLETRGAEISNDLKQIQSQVYQLNAKERDFYIKNLQPVEQKILDLREKGLSLDNALKQVEVDLNQSLDRIGGKSAAKLLIDTLRLVFR